MTILRGDRSPQPSRAGIAPAPAARESGLCTRSTRRLLTLAALATGTLMSSPVLARDAVASLPYAVLIEAQSAGAAVPDAAVQNTTAPADAPVPAPAPVAPAAQPVAADTPPPATTPPHAGTPADEHDIVVSGKNKAPPGDPMIGINLKSYAAVQAADKAIVGPAAMAYKKTLPSPLRMGLHNVLVNLREPPVAFAFLIEHKFGKAFETVGRFAINSTLGVAGIFDMAKRKPFHLPWRPNGMADAMGFYGIKPGPYFFLPLVGPTTLRDLIGTTIDRVGFPALYADELRGPAYGLAVTIIGGLDDRVMIDPQVREFREHSPDPYAAMRTFYMTRRQAEIDNLRGKPPLQDKISDYDFPNSPHDADVPADAPAAPAVTAPAAPAANPATAPATPETPAPAQPAPQTPPAAPANP